MGEYVTGFRFRGIGYPTMQKAFSSYGVSLSQKAEAIAETIPVLQSLDNAEIFARLR